MVIHSIFLPGAFVPGGNTWYTRRVLNFVQIQLIHNQKYYSNRPFDVHEELFYILIFVCVPGCKMSFLEINYLKPEHLAGFDQYKVNENKYASAILESED